MDRAESIAVKWASQSMGDTMDLAAEIRLAIVEAEQAAAREMPFDFVAALAIADKVFAQYHVDQPQWWKRMDGTPIMNDIPTRMALAFVNRVNIPLPTQALDLALEKAEQWRNYLHSLKKKWLSCFLAGEGTEREKRK
jgi:hypothetical protein